jgi:hypothetical protein
VKVGATFMPHVYFVISCLMALVVTILMPNQRNQSFKNLVANIWRPLVMGTQEK